MKRLFAVSITLLVLASFAIAQERRFNIDDLLKVRRVGDVQLSPKGDWVAFTITDMDKAANKGTTQIYLVSASGGEMRQLTNDEHSSASCAGLRMATSWRSSRRATVTIRFGRLMSPMAP